MDDATYDARIEARIECERGHQREAQIIAKDKSRDRERAQAEWKLEHEIFVDASRRQWFKLDAESRTRACDRRQKYEQVRKLKECGHANMLQVNAFHSA